MGNRLHTKLGINFQKNTKTAYLQSITVRRFFRSIAFTIFGQHIAGTSASGIYRFSTDRSLQTRDDIREYYREFFHPCQLVERVDISILVALGRGIGGSGSQSLCPGDGTDHG